MPYFTAVYFLKVKCQQMLFCLQSFYFRGAKLLVPSLLKANLALVTQDSRVSVQGVKSLGGHFACLCRGFEF